MNALLALALFASSSWASVVAPVEGRVATAGPSMTAIPTMAPAGGLSNMTPLGGMLDLRGGLPMLPSPVPGLVGPAAMNFVGEASQAAAAQAEAAPSAASTPRTYGQAQATRAHASEATPALPGKPSPGAAGLAIAVDRRNAASALGKGPAAPLLEGGVIGRAQPEAAAGVGRTFFDQSADKRRGSLEDAGDRSSQRPSLAGDARRAASPSAASREGARATGRLSPRAANGGASVSAGYAALGSGHVPAPTPFAEDARGETLHDAVAGAPAAAVTGGAAVFYRSAAPNGELAVPAAAAVLPFPGAPRPLALDLSGSGLIVRVRAALSGAAAPAPAALPLGLPAPGPSTALLERGGLLEAFSVAGDYAERSAAPSFAASRTAEDGVRRASAPLSPASEPAPLSLWWAWLALPLFVAAARRVL